MANVGTATPSRSARTPRFACPPRGYNGRRATILGGGARSPQPGLNGGTFLADRFVLALDQGTTSSRALVFDREARVRGARAGGIPADLPAAGLGRARPGRDLVVAIGRAARRARRRRASARATSPRSASPTSARRRCCGNARPASRSHNAIVWQDRRTAVDLRRASRSRDTPPRSPRRPVSSSTPTSPARSSSGCSITCPARATARARASSRSAPSTAGSSGS